MHLGLSQRWLANSVRSRQQPIRLFWRFQIKGSPTYVFLAVRCSTRHFLQGLNLTIFFSGKELAIACFFDKQVSQPRQDSRTAVVCRGPFVKCDVLKVRA